MITLHGISVYFACPHCALVYRSQQVPTAKLMGGEFDCLECRKTVTEWTGFHDYVRWKPVIHRTNETASGLRQSGGA